MRCCFNKCEYKLSNVASIQVIAFFKQSVLRIGRVWFIVCSDMILKFIINIMLRLV